MLLSSASALGPVAVDLGSSCNYTILSKSGVTNTAGLTRIVGNVGTSPIAATALTGFALVPTNAGTATSSTSIYVTGELTGASHLAPTPATLGAAVLDMQAAYTDAMGRPNPDFTNYYGSPNTGGTSIGGLTLAPGLYKWTTVVTVPVGNTVTFDGQGDSNAVWILQISGNLAIFTDAQILLINGAQAKNIFWAVAGDIAVGVDAHAEGIMLTYTMIALQTRSSLNGAAYAQTAVTLDDVNVIGKTACSAAPTPASRTTAEEEEVLCF